MRRPAARHALGASFASIALVLAACGGAPPAPTAAPKTEAKPTVAKPAESKPAAGSPVAASPSPAAAAASPSPAAAVGPVVSGQVDAVDGRILSVATNTGVRRVRVADNAAILIYGGGSAEDLKPGVMVGITGRPDGTAVSVRLFPPGITPKPSQFPMAGAQAGNIMTNASIVSFDGRALVVDLGGERATITVPPEAQIVKPVPSTFAEIKPGVRITAVGTPEGDVLAATSVTITT
jgi:hypothetical protein